MMHHICTRSYTELLGLMTSLDKSSCVHHPGVDTVVIVLFCYNNDLNFRCFGFGVLVAADWYLNPFLLV